MRCDARELYVTLMVGVAPLPAHHPIGVRIPGRVALRPEMPVLRPVLNLIVGNGSGQMPEFNCDVS
jgi:hypothetical protein